MVSSGFTTISSTATTTTITTGRINTVRVLLAHPDIDANAVEKDGRSVLFAVCGLGYTACAELLLNWSGGCVRYYPSGISLTREN